MNYQPVVPHWPHQAKALDVSKDAQEFALFMEQRTGKSKVLMDTCAYNYAKGRIRGLLLLAPNGPDADWLVPDTGHVAKHWPAWCGKPVVAHWERRLLKRDEAALYDPKTAVAMRVLVMNTEAFSTSAKAYKAAERFLRTFPCLMAVDESSFIKDPRSSRTKNIVKLGRLATMRRVLTGTPVTQAPLDVFAQFRFLNPALLGFSSFYSFKAHFAVLLPETNPLVSHVRGQRSFVPQIQAKDNEGRRLYRNLDELQRLIAPHCFRVTREQCPGAPKQVWATKGVRLSDEQVHYYKLAAEEVLVQTRTGTLTIENQLTRLLRLQQIVGGFLPFGEGLVEALPCPRLEAAMTEVEQLQGKVILWARFRPEIAALADALREAYGDLAVVEYHGGVKDDLRLRNRTEFQREDSPVRFIVGQPGAGGYGVELWRANDVLYYSNSFSLEHREQSEDRAVVMHKQGITGYLDLVAHDTVDEKIIAALREKRDVATYLLDSGGLAAWLKEGKIHG